MKLIAPHYYPAFRCIADRCVHSCCIGWEIGIDTDTRERYRALSGPFARRLNGCIDDGPDGATFRLAAGDRCPLLNANGLCDLITALGEESLCQICADHPRYRSPFAHCTEIGVGMCCEAAARLILGQEAPMRLITLEDDGIDLPTDGEEAELLAFRADCIALMQDRTLPVDARLEMLLAHAGCFTPLGPDEGWIALHRGLERLDPAWDAVLDMVAGPWDELPHLAVACEQFAVYLLHRHLPEALEDGDITGRVMFTALSTRLLMAICHAHERRHGHCTLDHCAEYARMWSAEIEYDEDNIAALLDALWEA